MLEINVLASSSKGNCYIISDGKNKLLIDPGIAIREIKQKGGFKIHEISACLISHEH